MTDELPGLARYIDALSAPVELREVADRPRRRGSRSGHAVAVAFVAVAAVIVAVVALEPRDRSAAPPASIPATRATNPSPTVTTRVAPLPRASVTGPLTAANREPAFLSTTEGWICDTPLRFTSDGGRTWRPISVGTTKIVYNDTCAFVPGGHAWTPSARPVT